MRKILLIIGCAATMMCFAQQQQQTGGNTATGSGVPIIGGTKKLDIAAANLGDPVLGGTVLEPGPKRKDFARAAPGRWQICTHACWLYGHIVAAAYSWYQPSDVPCGRVAWPGELVYFTEGYMDHGHVVVSDSGWTNGDGMQC